LKVQSLVDASSLGRLHDLPVRRLVCKAALVALVA
jgi:hypothetical protein